MGGSYGAVSVSGGVPVARRYSGPLQAASAAQGGGTGGGIPTVKGGAVTNKVAPNPEMQQFMGQIKGRIAQSQAKENTGDPNLTHQVQNYNERYAQSAGREGQVNPYQQESINNLRNRMSTDTTQRAIDVANQGVRQRADADQRALVENANRRGLEAGSGAIAGLSSKINSDAARDAARNAATISLGRERDLDALTLGGNSILQAPEASALTREGQTNSLLLGGQGIVSAPGQYGLQRENMTNNLLGQELSGAQAGTQAGLAQQGLNLNQWQAQQQAQIAQQQLAAQQAEQRQAQLLALSRMTGGF